jgi:hypothetical protein
MLKDAIFSVVNGILLKLCNHPDSEELMAVWRTSPGSGLKELNASPATGEMILVAILSRLDLDC